MRTRFWSLQPALREPLGEVLRALAGAKLDDPKLRQPERVKRVFGDDGLDLGAAARHRHDDAAVARDLPARDDEMARGIVLVQEGDVRRHVRIDLVEASLV